MSTEEPTKSINIKSTTIEKGLDLAKDFVGKLVSPSIEELGLLVKDQISSWRFSNQIKILSKAKSLCEKHNISINSISPKILCPYLENASLESDDDLQDKWANLLANMADSDQNIQNHVFPYILSQLSKQEFWALEFTFLRKKEREATLQAELAAHLLEKDSILTSLRKELEQLEQQRAEFPKDSKSAYTAEWSELRFKIIKKEQEISKVKAKEGLIKYKITLDEEFQQDTLQEFEVANIMRLGLIKTRYETNAEQQRINIPRPDYHEDNTVKFDIAIETSESLMLSQLGELFISACREKIS